MPLNLKEILKEKSQNIAADIDILQRTQRKKVLALARQKAAEIIVVKNFSKTELATIRTDYREFFQTGILEIQYVDYRAYDESHIRELMPDEYLSTSAASKYIGWNTIIQKELYVIRCKDVTHCTVNLNTDSISTANVTIKNQNRKYCFKENRTKRFHPLFEPMDKVQIRLEGRFKTGNWSVMYPVFTGYITDISHSFSGGYHYITFECEDKRKLLRISRGAIKPSLNPLEALGVVISAFTPPWWDKNAQDILKFIFGNIFCDFDLTKEYPQLAKKLQSIQKTYESLEAKSEDFTESLRSFTDYYSPRIYSILEPFFEKSGSYTRGYVTRKSERLPTELPSFIIRDAFNLPYTLNFTTDWNMFLSEWKTNLEICQEIRDVIQFKFYVNRRGQLIFEPLNTRLYHLGKDYPQLAKFYTIDDIDILSCNVRLSDIDLKTVALGKGLWRKLDTPEWTFGLVYKPQLIRKYGIRMYTPEPHPGLGETQSKKDTITVGNEEVRQYTETVLDRVNANVRTASLTILGRPELDLGFCVYVPGENFIGYVSGITHSFDYGTTFNTTLSLEYVRYPLGEITFPELSGWLTEQEFTPREIQLYQKNFFDLYFEEKLWEMVSPLLYGKESFSETVQAEDSYLSYLNDVAKWDTLHTNQDLSTEFKSKELTNIARQ